MPPPSPDEAGAPEKPELSRRRRRVISAQLLVGSGIVLAALAMSVFGNYSAGQEHSLQGANQVLSPPGPEHWFGTDELGRDLFTRVALGGRLMLGGAAFVVCVASVIGMVVGVMATLLGVWAERTIAAISAALASVPALVLAVALAMALGPGLLNMLVALIIALVPRYLKLAQAETLKLCYRGHLATAAAHGGSDWYLATRHVFPNLRPLVIARIAGDFGWAVATMAALGFLGLGARPTAANWGDLIATGNRFLEHQWGYLIMPGIAVLATVMGFRLIRAGLIGVGDNSPAPGER